LSSWRSVSIRSASSLGPERLQRDEVFQRGLAAGGFLRHLGRGVLGHLDHGARQDGLGLRFAELGLHLLVDALGEGGLDAPLPQDAQAFVRHEKPPRR
jgi:hypothetical protein